MKKIVITGVMVLVLSLICSCNKPTQKDLCIYDTKTEKTISIGDSKNEVNKLLGMPNEHRTYSEYEDNLHIAYVNEKVDYINVDIQHTKLCPNNDVNHSRYQLKRGGISAGSTLDEFKKQYKNAITDEIQTWSANYEKQPNGTYKALDDSIEKILESDKISNIYGIGVSIPYDGSDEDGIIGIKVGQIERICYGAGFSEILTDNQNNWETGYELFGDVGLDYEESILNKAQEELNNSSVIADSELDKKSENIREAIENLNLEKKRRKLQNN